jgi:phosphatidylglycerol:prolipoprotein diacylglycerol transferase
MFPTVEIGPMVLPTIGLVYLIGLWISLNIIERAAKSLAMHPELVYGLATSALAGGFVGARFVFVFQYWSAFSENPISMIWPLNTGFNGWGGLFFGLAAGFFYGRAKNLHFLSTADAVAPGLIAGFIFISLGDFLAGPGYGTLTNMPWGIAQFGVRRHPVQLYEIAVGLAALAIWYRTHPRSTFAGQLSLVTMTVYSAGRLFVEAFRDNAWLTPNGVHIVQIITFLAMLSGIFLLGRYDQSMGDNESSTTRN